MASLAREEYPQPSLEDERRTWARVQFVRARELEMADGYLTVMRPSKRPPMKMMRFSAASLLLSGVYSKAVSWGDYTSFSFREMRIEKMDHCSSYFKFKRCFE